LTNGTAPLLHERPCLKSNPEWNTPRLTHYREITGGLAYWAVRQIHRNRPYFPPKLEFTIGFLTAMIRPRFSKLGYAELSLCEISKMPYDVLMPEEFFRVWRDEAVMGKARLNLDALIRNVCLTIRDERRALDQFNEDIDRQYGDSPEPAAQEKRQINRFLRRWAHADPENAPKQNVYCRDDYDPRPSDRGFAHDEPHFHRHASYPAAGIPAPKPAFAAIGVSVADSRPNRTSAPSDCRQRVCVTITCTTFCRCGQNPHCQSP